MKKVLLLVGRTGVGKTTLAKALELYGLRILKSYTTRPMRVGEEDNADHIFISPEDVDKYKDDIIAYTKIGNYEYFATRSLLYNADVYIIDPNGIDALMNKNIDDIEFIIVYITADVDVRVNRLLKRGDSEESIRKRMIAEDDQFAKFEYEQRWDYLVSNNK